jgi:hypothetical protein
MHAQGPTAPDVEDLFSKYAKQTNVGPSSIVYQQHGGIELPGALLEPNFDNSSGDFAENP